MADAGVGGARSDHNVRKTDTARERHARSVAKTATPGSAVAIVGDRATRYTRMWRLYTAKAEKRPPLHHWMVGGEIAEDPHSRAICG